MYLLASFLASVPLLTALNMKQINKLVLISYICSLPPKNKKGFPYSLSSIGPRADPTAVQAVSTFCQACSYLPSLRASPRLGRYQVILLGDRYIGVNNLPKIVAQLLPRVGFEPTTCWSSPTLYPCTPRHPCCYLANNCKAPSVTRDIRVYNLPD